MTWRPPTKQEFALLSRLMAKDFPGRSELAVQLRTARVSPADQDGCLDIQVDEAASKTPVQYRVPVEAEALDDDGVPIHVLLHVVDGRVNELEMFKEDNSKIVRMPPAHEWNVFIL